MLQHMIARGTVQALPAGIPDFSEVKGRAGEGIGHNMERYRLEAKSGIFSCWIIARARDSYLFPYLLHPLEAPK